MGLAIDNDEITEAVNLNSDNFTRENTLFFSHQIQFNR